MTFRPLAEQLLTLPDHCEVWPGHLGGSMCGGPAMDMETSSTIGYERANNPTLHDHDMVLVGRDSRHRGVEAATMVSPQSLPRP